MFMDFYRPKPLELIQESPAQKSKDLALQAKNLASKVKSVSFQISALIQKKERLTTELQRQKLVLNKLRTQGQKTLKEVSLEEIPDQSSELENVSNDLKHYLELADFLAKDLDRNQVER